MADDIDYHALSDKTIDEIKAEVEENDIDLEQLLRAEKQNKDRKTLREWLEDRIDTEEVELHDETVDEAQEGDGQAGEEDQKAGTARPATSPDSRVATRFQLHARHMLLVGLVIGLVLGTVLAMAYTGSGTEYTADEAPDAVESMLIDRVGTTLPPNTSYNLTVARAPGQPYRDVHVLQFNFSSGLRDSSQRLYLTKQSGLLFFAPLDLSTGQPVDGQPVQ